MMSAITPEHWREQHEGDGGDRHVDETAQRGVLPDP
jgi:hypothetical protein